MTFTGFIGHDDAKLALILNAVDSRCGGVLFVGEKGCGKSTLARLYRRLMPAGMPFVNLPLNATEEALWGGVDLERTLAAGRRIEQGGLVNRAAGGILYIDDLNLLSADVMALVFKAQDSLHRTNPFTILASMNPEEGALSSHYLDRFGMCAVWEALRDAGERLAIMRYAVAGEIKALAREADAALRERITLARRNVEAVTVSPALRERITALCLERAVAGHRGDVFLFYAARAFAAFSGASEVTEDHVEKVAPLVLAHRSREIRNPEEDRQEENNKREERQDHQEDRQEAKNAAPETSPERAESQDDTNGEEPDRQAEQTRESRPDEAVFDLGQAFRVRRLAFRKDRRDRSLGGRRTKTGTLGKRGRYVKSLLRPNDDIAIDATLRAAAPFQAARGRRSKVVIHDTDLRFKKREKKMGHLVIFVVDGSGSMGARQRMIETKGAIQSLLVDSYQKRERVALIVFRRDRAEVVLPPTASLTEASRRLKEMPVGGKTPLSAGLLEAWRLIRRTAARTPQTRFLVVVTTDGRANHSLAEMPVREEIQRISALLSDLDAVDYVVIDTEEKGKFTTVDQARQIASSLGADYYTIDGLKSDYLVNIVRDKKKDIYTDQYV